MSTKFETEWTIGDRVYIDGDPSIKANIGAFQIGDLSQKAYLTWFHNGDEKSAYVNLRRLSKAE